MRKTLLTSILIVHAIAIPALAVTRYVPSQYSTIQTAINACNNEDTVILADGTYTGSGNHDIDFLGKAIIVRSQNGPENCIISCQGSETVPHRGFYFHSGEDANATLDGLTITGGFSNQGGGIYCDNASPTIINCVITGNQAKGANGADGTYGGFRGNPGSSGSHGYGGGVYCTNSSNPSLLNCNINNNSATGGAGGRGGSGSTYGGNGGNGGSGYGGGTYFASSGSVLLLDLTLAGNTAIGGAAGDGGPGGGGMGGPGDGGTGGNCYGGGIYHQSGNIEIKNCDLTNNSVNAGTGGDGWDAEDGGDSFGGAIYAVSGEIAIENCQFSDNLSNAGTGGYGYDGGDGGHGGHSYGGAIWASSNTSIKNSNIISNSVGGGDAGGASFYYFSYSGNGGNGYGGGIYSSSGNPEIANCTIIDNSASGGARGMGGYYWGNPGTGYGSAMYCGSGTTVNNSIVWANQITGSPIIKYSDVQGGYAGEGNIDAYPVFIDKDNDDYHLSLASPCINAGDPNGVYTDQNDIDGEPRMMDGRVDMGADEYRPPSYPISNPMGGTATQPGSGLDEIDPNRMVEITNGDACIKFVPLVDGGGSVTITELSCHSVNGDGVYIIENIRGIRAITTLDNGDFISTLKVFYEEQDLPEGWTERDLRIAQLQGVQTMPRWVAELMLYMLPEPHYGPPTFDVGDWGVDEEGNYVWANVDHFTDYGVGVKLVTGDYDSNKKVDFLDFSHFAFHWQDANCPDFEWCNGTDLDFSTVVDFNDLQIFASNWLYDANDPNTW